jgi:hypothetical protein
MTRWHIKSIYWTSTVLTRDKIIEAVKAFTARQTDASVAEISVMFGFPYNTVRGHFSNGRFPEARRGGRSKRIYSLETIKSYALWLYMSKESDSVLNFDAVRRDQLLSDIGVGRLWTAFETSDADLVRAVSA